MEQYNVTGMSCAACSARVKQLQEVIRLHDHIVEFEERQAFFQTFFKAFRCQHTVY